MIPLHRLTHPDAPVYVNPDLIAMIETTPDTVVSMTNASKLVIAESAEEVAALVVDWRARIVSEALEGVEDGAVTRARVVGIGSVSHLPAPHSA